MLALPFVVILAIAAAEQIPPPSIVILTDTGARHGALPVVQRHTDAEPYVALLTRGYSGRLLRLYQLVQYYVRPGTAPQPAYLLLSDNQGGFPRFGFELDGRAQPDAAYVDLHKRSTLSGRAGAIDQIFPHELLHIIVHDLAGEPPDGGASQVHAIGVRTDRITAFNEGLAEHAQVMAIDADDAAAETRALASDVRSRDAAFAAMAAYRRALVARWSLAPKARMTFPAWFSGTEQVLRYHGVRENLFARDADIPPRLMARDVYAAYLLENVLPGDARGPVRSITRLLSIEGVMSALFVRLVTEPGIQGRYRDDRFYERFGTVRGAVDPIDNAYLKLFVAIQRGGYDAAAVLRAWLELFPDDGADVMRVARAILHTDDLRTPPEIWLLDDRFAIGTTVFDQFRGGPRPHTFDLNASSPVDLAAVPGMTSEVAAAVIRGQPYAAVGDVGRVAGVGPELARELARMHQAMERQRAERNEAEATLSIRSILLPYLRRALAVLIAAACAAALLYRVGRRLRWWRLAFNGTAAALAGLIAGWTIDGGSGAFALVAPVVIFGVPGALVRALRTRSGRQGLTVLAAWTLAALPAALAVRPIG